MSLPKIISVDDHVVEPPEVWAERLPSRYRGVGPRVERHRVADITLAGSATYSLTLDTEDGKWGDVWFYENKPIYVHKRNVIIPISAVSDDPDGVSLDMAGMDLSAITYDEMIPGCYEPGSRIKDMARNWVDGSLCFPTFPRFCGQTFYEGSDKELGLLCVKAYNDWMVEIWCATVPDAGARLIPLCLIPLWDADLAAAEIRRNAQRGVRAVAFSEIPPHLGLPSIHSGYWDPFFRACEETRTVVNMHIGSSSKMPVTSKDAVPGVSGSLSWMNSTASLIDFLFSGVFIRFPNLKIAYSEGGIGWIPFALEKADDFWQQHSNWTKAKDRVPEPPSTYYSTHVYGCTIRDPFGLKNLDRVGVNNVTFETDYPHTDTTWPMTRQYAEKELQELPESVQYRILRGNAIEMLGLDME
jgi:predicted TIM-barrel fold metal-dependent hydrolase